MAFQCGFGGVHMPDVRHARPLPKISFQFGKLLGRARSVYFHAAVGAVPGPTAHTEGIGRALHKYAKSHALDAANYGISAGNFVGGFGFQTFFRFMES